ncbi:MAG TPA: UDP-2,4-diacetamido-2,4,6-trideoxy-beta-L-altropyranose hydrolase [Chthoniobacter sp.]|jgi:UDP-2,4-diacetamido-2,4,6-trideoxy-beta-L-altropyranose hydrolase
MASRLLTTEPVLMVRADMSAGIGSGHMMRCLALAQAWQADGGRAVFLSHDAPKSMVEELREQQFPVQSQPHTPGSHADALTTADQAVAHGVCWTVVDSYACDAGYLQQVEESGTRLLIFDDEGRGNHAAASLVLRPWLMGATPEDNCLDGPRYALLRQEFCACGEAAREIPAQARKFLLTLGGGDPENWTGKLLEVLAAPNSPLPADGELIVVIGACNPHAESLAGQLARLPCRARIERATREMARLLAWADIGVSASGSVCWEMCAVGLPALVLPLNDNQLPIARGLAAAGAAINLGLAGRFDAGSFIETLRSVAGNEDARRAMSAAGRRLVDGCGAMRVVTELKSKLFHLRSVRKEDEKLIWEWANDPVVRQASFRSDPISWEDHRRWFATKVSSSTTHIYIAELEDEPVAQVRFELDDSEAVISVSVSTKLRGRRYGSAILRRASREIFRSTPVERVVAFIKSGNAASQRAFSRAGFVHAEDTLEAGEAAAKYILHRVDCPLHERD